jgi:hypothetical protein
LSNITKLRETVEGFCRFIESLPPQATSEQTWGPKEVLAHLVFHHQSYVSQLEAIKDRKEPIPPEGLYRELNARAVAESRGVPIGVLLERFRDANGTLCDLYDSIGDQDISLEIKRGAKPRALTHLLPEVEAHIRNHLHKLEKAHTLG